MRRNQRTAWTGIRNEEPVTAEMGIAAVLILGSVALLLTVREAPVQGRLDEPVSSGA